MLRFSEDWENMSGEELYLLGIDPDIEWDPRIVDRLIEIGAGGFLYSAGGEWDDDRYDPRILERLLEVGDGEDLYFVGRNWDDHRYDPRVLDRLIEIGDGFYLYWIGRAWSDHRYDSRVAQALIDSKDRLRIKMALGTVSTMEPWKPERIRDLLMTWQGLGEDDV